MTQHAHSLNCDCIDCGPDAFDGSPTPSHGYGCFCDDCNYDEDDPYQRACVDPDECLNPHPYHDASECEFIHMYEPVDLPWRFVAWWWLRDRCKQVRSWMTAKLSWKEEDDDPIPF